jgi:hypothetical protein
MTNPRANSNSLCLTPNTETTYGATVLDLKAWADRNRGTAAVAVRGR